MNRLKLNFDLVYSDERAEFLQSYLQDPQFVFSPPTEAELETMGNYVLWGKNRATGLNAKQDGSVPLSSKSRDWDDARKVTSLEALLESATFSENQFVVNRPPLKAPRLCFARDHTRAKCPPAMLPTFEALWSEIDALDLRCSFGQWRMVAKNHLCGRPWRRSLRPTNWPKPKQKPTCGTLIPICARGID